jgi:hypothetical protein
MECGVTYSWIYPRLFTIWVLLASLILPDARANHDAKRLYDDLLKKNNYNRLIRPVQNSNDSLEIKMGLKLSQLADVVSLHHDLGRSVYEYVSVEDIQLGFGGWGGSL